MNVPPKMSLVSKLTTRDITPEDAVMQFESLPLTAQKGGRIYTQKNQDERRAQYLKARQIRAKIRENKVPFISPNFLPEFWLCQGLTVVGAESGKSKSTVCSNILNGFLESSDTRTAIVISNEEAADAVYERTACIALKKNYGAFFKRLLSDREINQVEDFVENHIIPRVEVVEEGSFDMSYIEDVQSVLECAVVQRVGIVLIDYLQIITQSRANPNAEPFQVSKKLGIYLKEYGKSNGIPVVCFTQLSSSSDTSSMAGRVQNDKTFYNHGFSCIEVIPNFETLTTVFKIHKDRFFENNGKEVTATFKGGRLDFLGDDQL